MEAITILYITDTGRALAERLKTRMPAAETLKFTSDAVEKHWPESNALVFIMAAGIVVRTIAPLLKDKKTDPAVVVLDELGKHAVSLAGGHIGGANELAREIAAFLGGEAVITTASDVNGLPSIDLWARAHELVIEDWSMLPQVGTRYVNNHGLRVYSDVQLEFPDEFLRVVDPRFADVVISHRRDVYAGAPRCGITGEGCSTEACRVKGQVYLRPRDLVVGIGCNSGTSVEEIETSVQTVLEEYNLSFLSIASLATIDIKADEPGLVSFAARHQHPLRTFSAAELNKVEGIERSDAVFKATGAYGVAEPAAILASGADKLIVPKQKKGNVTVAIALKNPEVRSRESEGKGRIFVVGTGPGSLDHMTPAARAAILRSDVIVGYGTYLDLITDLLTGKDVVSTGMTQEVDRCRKAVELAAAGKTVAVVSGGDPGIYAMAGLVYEILRNHEKSAIRNPQSAIAVEVIPGISALNAAAARLGAPLMHDFACISLSDRLTPWEMIEKRLEAAALADFVIVLYNPRSKGRAGHINRAREIVLRHRPPSTIVGIVKGALRENERIIVTDLENMQDHDIDMQTTVIIGNSKTFRWHDLMITPRGYENKFAI